MDLSMEASPGGSSAQGRRNGVGGRPRRSNSNFSSSSTSSDILVAGGPPATGSKQHSRAGSPFPSSSIMTVEKRIFAEVREGKTLVILAKNNAGLLLMRELRERLEREGHRVKELTSHVLPSAPTTDDGFADAEVKHEPDENDEGPNHRGTYSKAYILQHPEVKWVHRGQGRYLPSAVLLPHPGTIPLTMTELQASIRPHQSQSQGQLRDTLPRETSRKLSDESKLGSLLQTPQRRSSWAGREHDSMQQRPALRTRISDAQANPDSELRSARLGRRAKPVPTTESERRSSRISTVHNYIDEDSDDDEMARGDPTYDREYVEAHPDEQFYHTGNGWYKRGRRPRGRKNAKVREAEGHAIMRTSEGEFRFNPNRTIHVSQIDNYPGVEFHHCGNGWYRAGPDASGHRASRYGGDEGGDEDEGEMEEGQYDGQDDDQDDGQDDEDEESDEGEDVAGAVSKEYALRHPEIEWVHRGKGRYKRKSVVDALNAATTTSASIEPERDQQIYSKAYVLAHPDEEFHHRGNARYMRGPPPEHWASVRRKKSALGLVPEPEEDEDDDQLYSKAYVQAHPEKEFHHRGQGRYALGPRKSTTASENGEPDLFTTDYVDTHPNETFHHRGQGRWARGLPPLNASRKTAIRGPGALDRMSGEQDDDEDDANKPPPLTALVLRTEGPEKWPQLDWHYRGGGKWGRVTKQEFDDMLRGGNPARKPRAKVRMSRADGPEAQLEREAAAAAGNRLVDEDGFVVTGDFGVDGRASFLRPPIKRRRTGKRGSFLPQDETSKQSSNSQSLVPTPKPRMLEPEEDVLAEEDLPQLYRDDDWSPAPDDVEGQADSLLRNAYRPINPPEKFVKSLTKHDPAVRSLGNLKQLAANAQQALNAIQQEYLLLDKITAPHARIPRRPAKGGRAPVDAQIFEDKKESDLYDYVYDSRRIGYQDPQSQKIQRDAEGRELRNRRNRSGAVNGTLPGWNFGEDEQLGSKRTVKPVNRFDGIVDPPRKRARNSITNSKAPSPTPERSTPLGGPLRHGLGTATRGRLLGNFPTSKRIRELRDESTGGGAKRDVTPGGTVKKGRPPGSKNLHKRKDAGIKKGPRKPKVVDSIETSFGSEAEGDGEV